MEEDFYKNVSESQWGNWTESRNSSNHDDYYDVTIDYDLFEKYHRNRAVSDTAYWLLITAYTLLIVAGSIGNMLVIAAVANNKSKQKTIAISD